MTVLRTCLLTLFVAIFCGCNHGPRARANIDGMAMERRWIEDELYDAHYELKIQRALVERLKKENEKLRGQLRGGMPSTEPEKSGDAAPLPDNLSNVEIEIGRESPVDGSPADASNEPAENDDNSSPKSVRAPLEGPVTSQVNGAGGVRILGQQMRLGNWDDDPQPDGLSLALSMRGDDGAIQQPRAGISIDVWAAGSTSASQHPQPFANWVVSRDQLSQLVAASSTGRIRLELDWPDRPLPDGQWRVTVSFEGESSPADSYGFHKAKGKVTPSQRPQSSPASSSETSPDTWTPRSEATQRPRSSRPFKSLLKRRTPWRPNR